MTEELIAWAAGLYDGEGSSSSYVPRQRKTARRQMQISQGGVDSPPDVLVRFRGIVGEGNITGPYRGYLYYWKTTRKDVMDEVAKTLWPYLSAEKKDQYAAMTRLAGRELPFPVADVTRDQRTERAWAAGLFDGEGCLYLTPERSSGWRGVSLYLSQSSKAGSPDTILRFHLAVNGLGSLTGPHAPRSPWSRLPQYHWQTSGRHAVSRVLRILWPWLGAVTHERALRAGAHLDPDFADGRPADA